ncbi:MAG: hypothetical protein ACYC9Y_14375 [Candidatus Methylomirabilia bacterium]
MSVRRRVLISGATSAVGLAFLRDLSRAGFDPVGMDSRRLPFGLHSRRSGPYALHPGPGDPDFAAGVLRTVRELEPDVFQPIDTAITGLVAADAAAYGALTAVNVPEPSSFAAASSCEATVLTCLETGIPAPRVYSPAAAADLLAGESSPRQRPVLVVKPDREIGGARGVCYVSDPASLRAARARCAAAFGPDVIQEYIPGGADAMRTVLLLFDRDGGVLAHFTMRKIRQWPPSGGVTALGVSTDDRGLVESVLPFFRRRPWRGFAEVECKRDERDGVLKLIEINPRPTAYAGFPAACGLDLLALAARAALGEVFAGHPRPRYRTGVRFVNPLLLWRCVRHEARGDAGWLGALGGTARRMAGRFATNGSDLTDPLPVAGRLLRDAAQALGRGPRIPS